MPDIGTGGTAGTVTLQAVRDLYERGRTIEALRLAESAGPLPAWRGSEACVLAARLAANAGAPGLGLRLAARAWRSDPRRPEALVQFGFEVFSRRGPLAAWQRLRSWQPAPDDPPESVAELAALRGLAAAMLRDFALAETLLVEAEAIAPRRAWIRLQRASLLEQQDRVEEALEAAEEACALHAHPCYRPGVQTCAHLLQLLDRDDEAIALLDRAGRVIESGLVAAQLYALLSEHDRWAEAEHALARYVEQSPLLESKPYEWVQAQRARTAYRLGRRADAAHVARHLKDEFHKGFAARLDGDPPVPERVQFDVTFVRQHFKTCAPATLASIGRFWRLPADHLQLVEAICYDGTPIWHQRDWAEQHGWYVRAFRLTQESAVALVSAGVPFAVSVVEATSAHMMAVIGFDRTRDTLLLRDPSQPYVVEREAAAFLHGYRAFGPQAIAFVPAGERARLDGLALADWELYDDYHCLGRALAAHDRAAAVAALGRMESAAGDAPLTWDARLELAGYDANVIEQARCLDRLLELVPGNATRLLHRLSCLRDASRDERIALLGPACAAKDADPALLVALARTLQGDARCLPEARRKLSRALRARPFDPDAIQTLADLLWDQGALDEATECYRFAAHLDGFREPRYQAWFVACRRTRRTEEALAHLEDRFARFGGRSGQPALTLAWAWKEMEQPARARAVLEQAVRLRPDEGHLLVRAASLLAEHGDGAGAEAHLAAARGNVRDGDWLRARLDIAEGRHAYDEALDVARTLLSTEPLALDAHAAVARNLARREGLQPALAALQRACDAYPAHYGLRRMLAEWSSGAGPEAAERSVRALLQVEPSDAWARRELALTLLRSGRATEALDEALDAVRTEPSNSYSHSVLALVYRDLGQIAEARAHLQRAIELGVDNDSAIGALLDLGRTDEERRADLARIERELVRQVVAGDGLLAYVDYARPVLEPESLLAVLREAHAERPDLWHAWSALVAQLAHVQRLDEALAVARQAGDRFAHIPRAWVDLALVHRWRNEPDGEIAAAQRAFEANPAWVTGALVLTSALERRGRMDDAAAIYARALQHAPREAPLHRSHASLLWRLQRGAEALAAIEHALRLDSTADEAWDLLLDWSSQAGQPDRPGAFARTLADERPGEARLWLIHARMLTAPERFDERAGSVDRAIALDPRSVEAWDLRAEVTAVADRFDEAIRACEEGEAACGRGTPTLRGRRAWIEARRGRRTEAIRLMRRVLEENAGYVWGWHQIASWLLEDSALDEATAAFEHLQRLRPYDGWVSRQLAALHLERGNGPAARAALGAALESDPTDVAAAHGLLQSQLDAADLAGAETTLAVMQTHQPGAATAAADIALRLRQDRLPDALRALEGLGGSADPDPWPLDAAVHAFSAAGSGASALAVLRRCLRSPSCHPQVGAAIVQLLVNRRAWFRAVWIFLRLQDGEQQRRAAGPLAQGLTARRRTLPILWLVHRWRGAFHDDDTAWGSVGYALLTLRQRRQAVRWLADWRTRAAVEPWMIFNYCLALRQLGQDDEATDVARHVVQAMAHRDGAAFLRPILAAEDALAGDLDSAREHLQHVRPREDDPYDRQLAAIAEALVEFQAAPRAERRIAFGAVRARLDSRFGAWQIRRAERDVRRTFRRAGALFAREGAGWPARVWVAWKLYWHWSLLAAFVIVQIGRALARLTAA